MSLAIRLSLLELPDCVVNGSAPEFLPRLAGQNSLRKAIISLLFHYADEKSRCKKGQSQKSSETC